jgi:NitT/TauT family transport system substrate-binding protein
MSTMSGLPFIVAADKGINDTLGLKVQIVVFQTESDRDASFETGHLDGIVTDYTSAAYLQSRGIPLHAIMQNEDYMCLMTNRDSHINSIRKLKDCNFCVSNHSFTNYASDYILKKAKISSGRVNQPEISQIPLRMLMLEEGQIDATFLPDPYATIAMNSGSHTLLTTEELNMNQSTTIFSKKVLKEKTASVKALIKGYNIAVDYISSHRIDDWADVLTNRLNVPADVVGLIILPPYTHAQRPNTTEIAYAVQWLKDKNLIKKDYNGMNLVDSSIVEKEKVSKPKKKLWLHRHDRRTKNK